MAEGFNYWRSMLALVGILVALLMMLVNTNSSTRENAVNAKLTGISRRAGRSSPPLVTRRDRFDTTALLDRASPPHAPTPMATPPQEPSSLEQPEKNGTVVVTKTLVISAGVWRGLESALQCWSTRGAWVEVVAGHWRWVPDAEACPAYSDPRQSSELATRPSEMGTSNSASPSSFLACAVMQSLSKITPQPSPPRHLLKGHAVKSPLATAVFVGDSVSEQYFRTFSGWAFPNGSFSRAKVAPLPTAVATQDFNVFIGRTVPPTRQQPPKLKSTRHLQLARDPGSDSNTGSHRTASRALIMLRERPADSSCPTTVPLRMETPLVGCRAWGGSGVSALFQRSDRLLIDGDPRAECLWTGNFIDAPWTAEDGTGRTPALSPATRLVMLNRGAHTEDVPSTMEAWAAALREVRRAAPHALVVVRTTPAGHYDCSRYDRPLASPLPPRPAKRDKYGWQYFSIQNALLRELVSRDFPGVLVLDVEKLSALRPDAHAGAGDCLHWGNMRPGWRRREEVTEAPIVLLLNAVEWLRKRAVK